jgi:hypothetical protein
VHAIQCAPMAVMFPSQPGWKNSSNLFNYSNKIDNVIFKFVAKAYAIRLAPLAHRTIDRNQTAFIKDRCLHEGVLAPYEIAHELRVKKL